MKLALGLDLYRGATMEVPVDQVRRAEELGFHSVWTAEAYGSDAFSPLAYLAALTTRIKLGTDIAQIAARTPAATRDAGADHRRARGGRPGDRGARGLGPADRRGLVRPAVGQPQPSPARVRGDHAQGVRPGARSPTTASSSRCRTPAPVRSGRASRCDRSSTRRGRSVSGWRPADRRTPRSPRRCATASCRWVGDPTAPRSTAPTSTRGSRRAGAKPASFEIFTNATVMLTDDVRGALDAMKPLTAMYVGGMGSATHNFHREAMARRGFPEAAARIHELWMAGRSATPRSRRCPTSTSSRVR